MSEPSTYPAVLPLQQQVPLAKRTTLGVGGPARYWLDAPDGPTIARALQWAGDRRLAVEVLGGGSNVLVADRGLDALVLRVRSKQIKSWAEGDGIGVQAGAGVVWDELVEWTTSRGYAGLECLSGIPGDVGAAPIQNVGAYGQQVGDTLTAVDVIERATGKRRTLDLAACELGYRHSIFKGRAAGRYLIEAVRFRLTPDPPSEPRYPELQRALQGVARPGPLELRAAVLALRREKSMVFDPEDENHRSAGSFFLNPTVEPAVADQIASQSAEPPPRYPAPQGRVKLSAAWLIERAGLSRGTGRGPVGLSTKHTLAIVNRGGATAAQIVAFAAHVRDRVAGSFGVRLTVEPRLLGFEPAELAELAELCS